MTQWVVWIIVLTLLLAGCGQTPPATPGVTPSPTYTLALPTAPPIPPSPTLAIPTATPVPPTATPIPPTATPLPPTATPTPLVITLVPGEIPAPGAVYTRPVDGMVMVYVPASEFLKGSTDQDRQAEANERPQRAVQVDAFWIDRTEVTVAQFRAFVQASGYRTTAEQQGWAYAYVESAGEWQEVNGADWQHPFGPESDAEDNHPVVQVSWDDAAAYCTWVGGSLPDDAQWEKAARGTDGRIYPWGNDFDGTMLNYCDAQCGGERAYDDGYKYTAPVGSYPAGASPYGVLDMAGNIWEWTKTRVLRGGSWNHDRAGMRAAYRLQAPSNTCVDNFGFRCVAQAGN